MCVCMCGHMYVCLCMCRVCVYLFSCVFGPEDHILAVDPSEPSTVVCETGSLTKPQLSSRYKVESKPQRSLSASSLNTATPVLCHHSSFALCGPWDQRLVPMLLWQVLNDGVISPFLSSHKKSYPKIILLSISSS